MRGRSPSQGELREGLSTDAGGPAPDCSCGKTNTKTQTNNKTNTKTHKQQHKVVIGLTQKHTHTQHTQNNNAIQIQTNGPDCTLILNSAVGTGETAIFNAAKNREKAVFNFMAFHECEHQIYDNLEIVVGKVPKKRQEN